MKVFQHIIEIRSRHRKGKWGKAFSLTELMVVVGIIGILSAIAVPKMKQFIVKSKRATAVSCITNAGKIIDLYYIENSTLPKGMSYTPAFPSCDGTSTTCLSIDLNLTNCGSGNYTYSVALDPAPNGDTWVIQATSQDNVVSTDNLFESTAYAQGLAIGMMLPADGDMVRLNSNGLLCVGFDGVSHSYADPATCPNSGYFDSDARFDPDLDGCNDCGD